MIIYNYLDAIKRLVPKSEFNFPDLSDLGSLDWRSDPDLRPTDEAIEESLIQLNEEYDALAWERSRQEEYPTIAELTVALYDEDDKSAIETKRAAVKTKWPKDNSGPVE